MLVGLAEQGLLLRAVYLRRLNMDEFFSFMKDDCEVCGSSDVTFVHGFRVRYERRILPACDLCYQAAKDEFGSLSVAAACLPGG